MKRILYVALAVVLAALPVYADPTYKTQRVSLTVTPPATPGTVNGTSTTGVLGQFQTAEVVAALTGNTGGALDIYLQTSFDSGTTWCDYAHYTQLTAGQALTRWRFTISKTTPPNNTITACTDGVLAANTMLGGDWGDRFRLKAVSAASTSGSVLQTVFFTFGQ